jgi:hypothetical protein
VFEFVRSFICHAQVCQQEGGKNTGQERIVICPQKRKEKETQIASRWTTSVSKTEVGIGGDRRFGNGDSPKNTKGKGDANGKPVDDRHEVDRKIILFRQYSSFQTYGPFFLKIHAQAGLG